MLDLSHTYIHIILSEFTSMRARVQSIENGTCINFVLALDITIYNRYCYSYLNRIPPSLIFLLPFPFQPLSNLFILRRPEDYVNPRGRRAKVACRATRAKVEITSFQTTLGSGWKAAAVFLTYNRSSNYAGNFSFETLPRIFKINIVEKREEKKIVQIY